MFRKMTGKKSKVSSKKGEKEEKNPPPQRRIRCDLCLMKLN